MSRNGTPWNEREDATVSNLWKSGASDKEIGLLLGRTWQSVKARRLEKRWVAPPTYSRDTINPNLGPLACNDVQAFRATTAHATELLIERIEAGIANGTLRSPARAA